MESNLFVFFFLFVYRLRKVASLLPPHLEGKKLIECASVRRHRKTESPTQSSRWWLYLTFALVMAILHFPSVGWCRFPWRYDNAIESSRSDDWILCPPFHPHFRPPTMHHDLQRKMTWYTILLQTQPVNTDRSYCEDPAWLVAQKLTIF